MEIFKNSEIVVERELLRHVADVLTHFLGLAADIESGNLSTARRGFQ